MERVIGLHEAAPWVAAHAGAVFVVKTGGEILDVPAWLDAVARDVATLRRLGLRMVVVHGGGPQLDRAAADAKLATERVAGRRITSAALRDLAVATWRGTLSARWVAALARHDCPGVGLGAYDGGLIEAERRPPAVLTDDDGARRTVDFGYVGDIVRVRPTLLEALFEQAVPVISPLALGTDGELLNVNADTVAAALAVALGARSLVLMTQTAGLLSDPDDPSSLLARAEVHEIDALEASGAVRGGMRPKLAAVRKALAGGVERVHIVDGRVPGALAMELLTAEGCGTLLVPDGA